MAVICSKCGVKQPLMAAFQRNADASTYLCPGCAAIVAKEKAERLQKITEAAKSVIVTTTPSVDGYRVVWYLGIESVEFVIGTGVFSEFTTDVQDFFGKRSSAFEGKLQLAKRTALQAMMMLAAERGANAVVGVDLDFTEFSGNRVGLILNGTLVEIAPL